MDKKLKLKLVKYRSFAKVYTQQCCDSLSYAACNIRILDLKNEIFIQGSKFTETMRAIHDE